LVTPYGQLRADQQTDTYWSGEGYPKHLWRVDRRYVLARRCRL
jgi:hypothetical protein